MKDVTGRERRRKQKANTLNVHAQTSKTFRGVKCFVISAFSSPIDNVNVRSVREVKKQELQKVNLIDTVQSTRKSKRKRKKTPSEKSAENSPSLPT